MLCVFLPQVRDAKKEKKENIYELKKTQQSRVT